jgi:hypothetical protein
MLPPDAAAGATDNERSIVSATVRRRKLALVLVSMTLMVRLAAADTVDTTGARPAVAIAEGVPGDFEDLALATWVVFTEAFPARRDCLASVTVDAAWVLDDLAAYDPSRRLVTVRIPGTAPNLRASLVHEFAHHLEFTCPAQRALRPSFLAAQGLSRDAPWFKGATWERTPSEQFAEATTEFVLGHRNAHVPTVVTAQAVQTVRTWARRN